MKKILFLITLLTTQLTATIYLEPTPQFKPLFEVATVYIENNGQILLLHRQNDKVQGNKWGVPGGKVEKNETALQAVIRETREEIGIDLANQTIETLKIGYVEQSEKNHFVHHSFRTQLPGDPADIRINFNEHKGFTWVTPAEALKMDLLQDGDACIIKDYFSQ